MKDGAYKSNPHFPVPGTTLRLEVDFLRSEIVLLDYLNNYYVALPLDATEVEKIAHSLDGGAIPYDLVDRIKKEGHRDRISMGGP
ncbi:MAG: hypothetical protein CL675_14045 [Bdellovibrionaceae bacterium]|jgi:hypothetical protein|nr:hypothetical protein [Pseudobdellovibrionaceae bacterium]